MCKVYNYKVIREDMQGNRGKKVRTYYSFTDKLKVGGLYAQLGRGFPGLQRVLSMTTEELAD